MTHFAAILLTALLLIPGAATSAAAKATSSAPAVHVVKQGDTLYDIAQRHGLTVNELKRLNGLGSSRLKIGQKLALTKAAAPPAPQKAKAAGKPVAKSPGTQPQAGGGKVHVVRSGDTLSAIASRHGLSVATLKKLNGLSGNRLKIGQHLALAEPASTAPARTKHAQPAANEVHVVRKGDTLYGIARRHGMAVDDLKRINDLAGSSLRIGQRLALASPTPDPSPLLLPGDSGEDEVLELAYSAESELEQAAYNFLSTPYRFGGNSRKGIDCSAFVQQVFREVDVKLPRSAREQFRVGSEVDREELQKGDLIFFRTYAKYPSHVGIYLGDNKMIHASSRSRRVVVTSIDHPYYQKRFIGAKRVTLLDGEEIGAVTNAIEDEMGDEVEDAAPPVEVATGNPAAGRAAGSVAVATDPAAAKKADQSLPPAAPVN